MVFDEFDSKLKAHPVLDILRGGLQKFLINFFMVFKLRF